MTFKLHVPVITIVVALCLFAIAAVHYPGGTTESDSTVGYSWTHNFISSLFASRALNGAANPARYIAIPAMLSLCAGLAMVFVWISSKIESRAHKKAIQIGGIGSMVYACLVVTPLHDLMVSIALIFAFVALIAILHFLFVKRLWTLFSCGAICVALLSLSAVMYYGKVLYGLLPLIQKASLIACIGWLLSLYYAPLSTGTARAEANKAVEPRS